MNKQPFFFPEDVYRELTGRNPSSEQLYRCRRLQRALDINRGDAIWAVIIAFEFYDDCFTRSAAKVVFWAKIIIVLMIVAIFLLFLILRSIYIH